MSNDLPRSKLGPIPAEHFENDFAAPKPLSDADKAKAAEFAEKRLAEARKLKAAKPSG